jgi:gluconolactonase
VIESPRLVKVVNADAHEGPVYVPAVDALYFTTSRSEQGVRIRRLALDGERFPLEAERLSTVATCATMANGMALDDGGRLLVCEQGSRTAPACISRIDLRTGERSIVADQWQGLPLNSPNDVAQKRDGSIWFTDPSYGALQGFRDAPALGDYVYRWDPRTGQLNVVADCFDKPNGLAFSADESVLYVGDSGAIHGPDDYSVQRRHHVLAFDVVDSRLRHERLFAVTARGFPDGIKVDTGGRVYVSCFDGIQVFSPNGDLLGNIQLPGAVNFTFGGLSRNVLFITADSAIWAAHLDAQGAYTSS